MQGFERADRQFLDAAALAGHLVPAGSMFAFLAARRVDLWSCNGTGAQQWKLAGGELVNPESVSAWTYQAPPPMAASL